MLEHNKEDLLAKNISSGAAHYLIKRANNFSINELRKLLILFDNAEKAMKENDKIAWDILFFSLINHYNQQNIKK